MPRDEYQRARERDHQKAANAQLAEFGQFTTYESVFDGLPQPTIWEDEPVKLKDWLNELRRRAGKLGDKISHFRKTPSLGDRSAVLLIAYALSTSRGEEISLVTDLVRCVGQRAVEEVRRLCNSADPVIRKNALRVLSHNPRLGADVPPDGELQPVPVRHKRKSARGAKPTQIKVQPPRERWRGSRNEPRISRRLPTIPELAQFLSDDDPKVRLNAVQRLAELTSHAEHLLPKLRQMQSDSNSAVQNASVTVVREIELAIRNRNLAEAGKNRLKEIKNRKKQRKPR